MNILNRIPLLGDMKRLSLFCISVTVLALGYFCIQIDQAEQDYKQLQIAYNEQFDKNNAARNREKDLNNVITQQIENYAQLETKYNTAQENSLALKQENEKLISTIKELEQRIEKLEEEEEEEEPTPSRGVSSSSSSSSSTSSLTNKNVGWFKSYTNYKVLKQDPSYPTWQLQMKAYTDSRGFRRIDDYYLCAIGTGWGLKVKDKAIVYLSTGESFKMIMCDTKANKHTDSKNIYTLSDRSIVEFYIDKSVFSDPKKHGDVSKIYSEFSGRVVNIVKI